MSESQNTRSNRLTAVADEAQDRLDTLQRFIDELDTMVSIQVNTRQPLTLLDSVLHHVPLIDALAHNDHYHDFKVLFPNILWTSVFLTGYFILENYLDEVCQYWKLSQGLALATSDLKHKGIKASQIYLSAVVKCSFPVASPQWQRLLGANLVRNRLVHGAGNVSLLPAGSKLLNYLESNLSFASLINALSSQNTMFSVSWMIPSHCSTVLARTLLTAIRCFDTLSHPSDNNWKSQNVQTAIFS